MAGSLALDLSCDYTPLIGSSNGLSPQLQTSNPARITHNLGGVGHNVARAAHLMGASVKLCSAVGNDWAGEAAIGNLKKMGMDTSQVRVDSDPKTSTAQYISFNDANKDMVMAMSDMSILQKRPDRFVAAVQSTLERESPSWFVVDANWEPKTLRDMVEAARPTSARIAFEPVSTTKAARLFAQDPNRPTPVFPTPLIDLATPNALELAAMNLTARKAELFERQDWFEVIDALGIPMSGLSRELARATSPALVDAGIPQQCIQLLPFVPCILTKLGADGVLLVRLLPAGDERLTSAASARYILARSQTGAYGVGGLYVRHYNAAQQVPQAEVVSVNGVGDTFLGALVAALTLSKVPRIEDMIDVAQQASVLTLKSPEAVSLEVATLRTLLGR